MYYNIYIPIISASSRVMNIFTAAGRKTALRRGDEAVEGGMAVYIYIVYIIISYIRVGYMYGVKRLAGRGLRPRGGGRKRAPSDSVK